MINQRELAVCKRRGHDRSAREDWMQCKWCGIWHREVRRLEEREDEPPETELDPMVKLDRHLADSKKRQEQVRKLLDKSDAKTKDKKKSGKKNTGS